MLKLILILFIFACEMPTNTNTQKLPDIDSIQLEFNEDNNELYIAFDIINYNKVDSIFTYMFLKNDTTDSTLFILNDNGIEGDIIPNDGKYSSISILEDFDYGDYLLYTIIYDYQENIFYLEHEISIHANFPPEIIAVDFPEIFYLDNFNWTNLELLITIFDLNGINDIKYVRYMINTDFLTKDDPLIDGCDYYYIENPDENNYIQDPSWFMEYAGEIDTEFGTAYLFTTSIPMRPSIECGGFGPVFFSFTTSDINNYTDTISEQLIEIISCGDDICSEEFESCENCPQDCDECND